MKNLLLIFLSILLFSKIHTQWSQTNGPNASSIRDLICDPMGIYISTPDAVYVSKDNAITWIQLPNKGIQIPIRNFQFSSKDYSKENGCSPMKIPSIIS